MGKTCFQYREDRVSCGAWPVKNDVTQDVTKTDCPKCIKAINLHLVATPEKPSYMKHWELGYEGTKAIKKALGDAYDAGLQAALSKDVVVAALAEQDIKPVMGWGVIDGKILTHAEWDYFGKCGADNRALEKQVKDLKNQLTLANRAKLQLAKVMHEAINEVINTY